LESQTGHFIEHTPGETTNLNHSLRHQSRWHDLEQNSENQKNAARYHEICFCSMKESIAAIGRHRPNVRQLITNNKSISQGTFIDLINT
jgi:hypothetical protein